MLYTQAQALARDTVDELGCPPVLTTAGAELTGADPKSLVFSRDNRVMIESRLTYELLHDRANSTASGVESARIHWKHLVARALAEALPVPKYGFYVADSYRVLELGDLSAQEHVVRIVQLRLNLDTHFPRTSELLDGVSPQREVYVADSIKGLLIVYATQRMMSTPEQISYSRLSPFGTLDANQLLALPLELAAAAVYGDVTNSWPDGAPHHVP